MTDRDNFESAFLNADCMKVMREYPDGFFDLAICDPPYGLKITERHKTDKALVPLVGGGGRSFGGSRRAGSRSSCDSGGYYDERRSPLLKIPSKFYHAFDDSSAPDAEYFKELKRVSKNQIIWGANFFGNMPIASCWIVWDKKRRGMDQADCELAWTSFNGQSRIFEWKWNGMLQQDMKNKEERIHPTQKPVALYKWLIDKFSKPGDIILDTHVGSASSLIACHERNRRYLGCEIDSYYYKAASERLSASTAQGNIFQFL